jgi:hypothetical protein
VFDIPLLEIEIIITIRHEIGPDRHVTALSDSNTVKYNTIV